MSDKRGQKWRANDNECSPVAIIRSCIFISLGVVLGTLHYSVLSLQLIDASTLVHRNQEEMNAPLLASNPDRGHKQGSFKYKTKPMTQEHLSQLRGPEGPKYNVLVTGAAGFIGMHTSIELKRMGMTPIGYDNVNTYYSTDLKESRINELRKHDIDFERGDVCDMGDLKQVIKNKNVTRFIHLAAQAGVRYSLDHPFDYTKNNIDCTVNLLEVMKELNLIEHPLIYASSSSVYGNNVKVPFEETDPVEDPASLYAATKRSDELITRTYFNLYNISSIGLRFFTVYGPYGRPDMAPWIFTDKISNGEKIQVFNNGMSRRDFTYIDDIVQGVVNSLLLDKSKHSLEAEVINLGNGRPVLLADFVRIVKDRVGKTVYIKETGMQKGDVPVTYADISKARHLLGYRPSTSIEEGMDKFVTWFEEENATRYRMGKKTSSSKKRDEEKPKPAGKSSSSSKPKKKQIIPISHILDEMNTVKEER